MDTTTLYMVDFNNKAVVAKIQLENPEWEVQEDLDSTCFKKVFYNFKKEEMIVEFKQGVFYKYKDVCEHIYNQIFNSDGSIGLNYHKNKVFLTPVGETTEPNVG